MKKNLYLHAGISKTGSSYLQSNFYFNSVEFAKEDCLYLDSGRASREAVAHSHFAYTMLEKYPACAKAEEKPGFDAVIKEIDGEVRASPGTNFVCSSEPILSVCNEGKLKKLASGLRKVAECKVVRLFSFSKSLTHGSRAGISK